MPADPARRRDPYDDTYLDWMAAIRLRVRLSCVPCGRRVQLEPRDLERFPRDSRLDDLARVAACRQCGARMTIEVLKETPRWLADENGQRGGLEPRLSVVVWPQPQLAKPGGAG